MPLHTLSIGGMRLMVLQEDVEKAKPLVEAFNNEIALQNEAIEDDSDYKKEQEAFTQNNFRACLFVFIASLIFLSVLLYSNLS